MCSIDQLREFVEGLQEGEITDPRTNTEVRGFLYECWKSLHGSNVQNTTPEKVCRLESLNWNPPILSFILERHGGTVNGSTRGELHHWEVDLKNGCAHISKIGHRQLAPKAPCWSAKSAAEEVSKKIIALEDDPRLVWNNERTEVWIPLRTFIHGKFQRTIFSRRHRFLEHLRKFLMTAGCGIKFTYDQNDLWPK